MVDLDLDLDLDLELDLDLDLDLDLELDLDLDLELRQDLLWLREESTIDRWNGMARHGWNGEFGFVKRSEAKPM